MVAAGVNPAAKATLDKYERNPDGSLSSAGRFATGLLSLRYTVLDLSELPLEATTGDQAA